MRVCRQKTCMLACHSICGQMSYVGLKNARTRAVEAEHKLAQSKSRVWTSSAQLLCHHSRWGTPISGWPRSYCRLLRSIRRETGHDTNKQTKPQHLPWPRKRFEFYAYAVYCLLNCKLLSSRLPRNGITCGDARPKHCQ